MKAALQQLGLTQGEATVYAYLSSHKQATATQISKATSIHRTTVYEFLEKLQIKGLVTYVTEANTKKFSITSPEKLKDFVQEKQDVAEELVDLLKTRTQSTSQEPIIEVHKGKEGIKFLLNDILRSNQNYVCVGINEQDWDEKFELETKRHMKKELKQGIKWRGIISDSQTVAYSIGNYRCISRDYFVESPIITYANNTAFVVWEPLVIIIMRNKQIAAAHKKHFELMWNIAKKPKIKKQIRYH